MNEEDVFTYCEEIMKTTITERAGLEELQEYAKISPDSYMKNKVNEWLENYCDIRGLCTKCFSELEYQTHKESRGEYLGTPCSESMVESYCPYCDM